MVRPCPGIGDTPGVYTGAGVGLPIALLAPAFRHPTAEDQGGVLAIRFGPVPLFRRTIRCADLGLSQAGRTLLLDGWGTHDSIRGCGVWNP